MPDVTAKAAASVQRLGTSTDILGECPVWSAAQQALFWVDVRRPSLQRRESATGRLTVWPMPDLIGSFALQPDGQVIIALRHGIVRFDLDRKVIEMLAEPHNQSTMRFNDGKCDRQGRFWAGSMDDVGRGPVGTLYRLDAHGCTPVVLGISVPNSLCWSPDGQTMYFADGQEPVIWAFPFDTRSGTVGPRRRFAHLAPGTGIPDGATVDAEGFLWSAQYGGSCITRYRPDGVVDRVIPLPITQPTSCAFGGPNLDTLFITTASQRLSPEELAAQGWAGALLAIQPGVCGLPEPDYTGGPP